mgnify:CR=1 FL=1
MPDLQSELKKTLNQWGSIPAVGKQLFAPSNNVCRVTFDYMKTHPGLTASQVSTELEKLGYKRSSVTAVMAQIARQGLARKDGFKYYITADQYQPLKTWKKTKVEKPVEQEVVKQEVVRAVPVAHVAADLLSPESVVEKVKRLSMQEAHALYVELHTYFGDKK